MIDVEPVIREQLERRVPAIDVGTADWLDIRRRARADLRRRRLFAAAVAAAVAAAIIVTPALGVRDRLLDFFGLAAPPDVKTAVDEAGGPDKRAVEWLAGQGLDIDLDTIRGIAAVQIPAGTVRLWGADAREGDLRVRFVQIPVPGGGRPSEILTGLITTADAPRLDGGVETAADYRGLVRPIVHGQVNPPATSVRVRYDDEAVQSVPLIDGYFLAVLERSRGSLTIEAMDASGQVVGAATATLDPSLPTPQRPIQPPETRPLITIPLPDATATLLVLPGANPARCYRIAVAADDGSRSGTASCPGVVSELDYGLQQVGNAPDATVLLFGGSKSTIAKARVKVGDRWLPVASKEQYFLVALRPDQRPSAIEVTSPSGAVKQREIRLNG